MYYSSIEGRNHHQYVLAVGTWCKLHPIDNSLVRQEKSPTVWGFTVGRILTTCMIVSGGRRSHWQNDHEQEVTSPTEWLLAGRDVTIEMITDKKGCHQTHHLSGERVVYHPHSPPMQCQHWKINFYTKQVRKKIWRRFTGV